MNGPDYMRGRHWLKKGIPFTYFRIDSAEAYEVQMQGINAPCKIDNDPVIMIFDFLLVGQPLQK